MDLPTESVTLSAEQVDALKKKLSDMRHEVNNNLALIMAAVEIMKFKPESATEIQQRLGEKPQKIVGAVTQFSKEMEEALGLKKG